MILGIVSAALVIGGLIGVCVATVAMRNDRRRRQKPPAPDRSHVRVIRDSRFDLERYEDVDDE